MISSQTSPGATPLSLMIRLTCAGSVGSRTGAPRIHVQLQRAAVARVPLRELAAALLEGPVADRDDRAGALGVADELRRGKRPRCACSQRTSASKPATRPVAQLTIGR